MRTPLNHFFTYCTFSRLPVYGWDQIQLQSWNLLTYHNTLMRILMRTSNIHITSPLWGESMGDRWISSNAENILDQCILVVAYFADLAHCINTIANALEVLQSCAKPSIIYSPRKSTTNVVIRKWLYFMYVLVKSLNSVYCVGNIHVNTEPNRAAQLPIYHSSIC